MKKRLTYRQRQQRKANWQIAGTIALTVVGMPAVMFWAACYGEILANNPAGLHALLHIFG